MSPCRLVRVGRLLVSLLSWDPGGSLCRALASSPVGVPAPPGCSEARFMDVPGLQSMASLGGPDRWSRSPSISCLHPCPQITCKSHRDLQSSQR